MPCQTFRRHPVVPEHVVQVAVVKGLIDIRLQRRKLVIVAHETMLVQRFARKLDLDDVVVPVQPRALMLGRQVLQLMRGGEMEFLGDAEHYSTSSATKEPVTVTQKSASSYAVGSATSAR